MTKSRQRLFIADSLPIFRGVPAERLRRRCPFGRPSNILRFNVFRSDSPLLLRSDLWLSLSRGWLCGLVCSLDSEGTPLVIGCSNFLRLRSSTGVPTCTRWRLCGCPASSHRTLYRIKRCRGRIEFVERSVGTESRLHSVISGPRLTGTARGGHCRVLVKNPRLLQIRRIRNQAVASHDNKQLHIERRLLAD